jgi:hypothetical protein
MRMIEEAMKQDECETGGGKTMDKIVKNLLCAAIILFAAISLASATEVFIYPAHHHLGDNFKEELTPGEPEGLVYTTTFNLDSQADITGAELRLTTKSVVPGPTDEFLDKVYLNGMELGTLNDHISEQTPDDGAIDIVIPVDPSILKSGINTIRITSGGDAEGSNYDDFEFYNLQLTIWKSGRILSGSVVYKGEPASCVQVHIYRYGTEELVSSCTTDENGFYSTELPNGVYGVKAERYDNLYGGHASDTEKIVIEDSDVSLDLEMSDFGGRTIIVLLLAPVVVLALHGFATAITVYVFTRKRKLAVIGFVLGTIAAFAVLFLLYQIGVADMLERWTLLLSAGIVIGVVAVPIILLEQKETRGGR